MHSEPSAHWCLPVVQAEDSSSQVTPNLPSGHSQLQFQKSKNIL